MIKELYKIYKTSDKKIKFGFFLFISCAFLILWLPLLLTKFTIISLDVDGANEIGDTIGGIMGPFVGLLAAFLTFLAFWIQYKANQKVQEQFLKQELNNKLYHYHDLINKNRAKIENNISLKIHDIKYKSFDAIIYSYNVFFCQILEIDYFLYNLENFKKINLSYFDINNKDSLYPIDKRILLIADITWKFIFNGILDKSYYQENFFINTHNLLEYNILKDKKPLTQKYNLQYIVFDKVSDDLKGIISLPSVEIKKHLDDIFKNNFSSIENNGYFNELSPYFQLYFQAIKLINDSTILNYKEKYEFAKMYRAEMTKGEIQVFFLNSLSEYGRDWELKSRKNFNDIKNINSIDANNCLITKYNIIKHIDNLNLDGIDIKKIFPNLMFSSDHPNLNAEKKNYRYKIFN